ncbi:recombination directionality factor [Pseudoduganella violacea]|uniref:Uncharacterized protein n=1 Tax=Pseudoduganella violacea TaxID=1715466 RepID=A0A7W5FWC9_9BURK|nr:hypothetical protein [Pseudoduganella violacea]MBB3121701.1 hypothetical protein [Pseudoduganella violacea]
MNAHSLSTLPPRATAPTLLGQRQVRIPTAGKIRAGIKVLTKAAASDPRIRTLYEQGLAQHATFEQIEQRIAAAFPEVKSPLVPKNVAWFTVRPNDFPNPALAAQILAAYGEDRGDGVARLYRFPVVFPADTWQAVMPHELACWGRNEKRYWSTYAEDGHTRHCTMFAPAKMDPNRQRAVRLFGGRATQLRPENGGRCDPEVCPEFQSRQCNLSGRFIFYIPGIRSLDAFELHTNSFYAMSRAIERFEAIAFMRGGRLAGFLDHERTPLYLTKHLREVSHIDPKTGQPVRSAHWIIELEAPVDVAALLSPPDDESVLRQAAQSVQALQGHAGFGTDTPPQADLTETPAPVRESSVAPRASAAPPAPAGAETGTGEADATDIDAIHALAASYGVAPERFDAFADWCWGAGWRRNRQGRARALAELQRYRDEPARFIARIHDELGDQ